MSPLPSFLLPIFFISKLLHLLIIFWTTFLSRLFILWKVYFCVVIVLDRRFALHNLKDNFFKKSKIQNFLGENRKFFCKDREQQIFLFTFTGSSPGRWVGGKAILMTADCSQIFFLLSERRWSGAYMYRISNYPLFDISFLSLYSSRLWKWVESYCSLFYNLCKRETLFF